ncbi:hypothetical protein AYL99_07483 [Fonsecaea erecta]|uniref:Uncharacterized protein n=1 Tax=Fonsecaea erecta TaxID=1367422 RepID=A0A178ZGT0_9EURO|nr:hypothetical protein AYL99_07483 [Fonsecaea erecta]OAP58393.1 hypothetical protein AYL99_07483 [Fonsecaea erecta]
MATEVDIGALEERNRQLTESLSTTRQRLVELTSELHQLTDYVDQYSRPHSYSSALGYTSPFPLNAVAPPPRSPRHSTKHGGYNSGPLSDLFVDHDRESTPSVHVVTPSPPNAFVQGAISLSYNEETTKSLIDPSSNYPVGRPSDACLDIIHHEGLVRQIMIQEYAEDPAHCQSLDSLIARMLQSLLSSEKWERLSLFCHAVSGWDKLGPITRWRLEPTAKHYMQLTPCYRPSRVQMTRHHWPIVDWLPFPKIRDILVLHPERYDLNKVCLELNASFCLEMEFANAYPDAEQGDSGTAPSSFGPITRVCETVGSGGSTRSPTNIFTNAHQGRNRPRNDVVYVLLQEYVNHRTGADSLTTMGQSHHRRVNENILTHLLLAFRQLENPFKLHSKFFDQFPDLPRDLYMVRGEQEALKQPILDAVGRGFGRNPLLQRICSQAFQDGVEIILGEMLTGVSKKGRQEN